MGADTVQDYRVLIYHSSLTCTLFGGIIILLFYSDSLSIIGTPKFFSVLLTIVLAEIIKLSITSQLNYALIKKLNPNHFTPAKKNFLKTAKQFLKSVLAVIGVTIVYYVAIVLLGAPLLTDQEETLMLSITLTCLTFIPATLHLGFDNALTVFLDIEELPVSGAFVDAVKLNIQCVIFFTWLSAFVLPLDWDRHWQAWPIPCVLGALVGYFIAHFITFIKISSAKLKKKTKKSELLKSC